VWQPQDGGSYRGAVKGAPEAIADLCPLDEAARRTLAAEVDRLAAAGMRVLSVAEATAEDPLPETPRGFSFTLLGLAGLADPLRTSVPAAIRECRAAGIRVVVITGDYPITARAIARQAGLEGEDVLDGSAIGRMSEAELCGGRQARQRFRPHRASSEAADRLGIQGGWRGGRDDGRRRE
jgi:Ca2+-transporting ATPase